MNEDKRTDQYSDRETVQRREAALKRMLSTPHKPHKPIGRRRPSLKDKRPTVEK